MFKLFSTQHNKFIKPINKSEAQLNKFLSNNWKDFFPQFKFIKSEFALEGNVRSRGSSGRVDILAFNPKSNKFVVFELKKNKDKNIRNQVSDYRDFIEDNFSDIYLLALQKYNVELPKYNKIDKDSIEVVMIAKSFSQTDVDRVRKSKSKNQTTLIRYVWFENQLLLIDYLNNDPDELLEKENTEKIKKIKEILGESKENFFDKFFFKLPEAKRLFYIKYHFLKKLGKVESEVQQTKIKLRIFDSTFSVIGFGGKTGRKSHLQINTDIDEVIGLNDIIIEDRIRPGKKKKGSLGIERYEVFIRNEEELVKYLTIVEKHLKNTSN